MVDSCDDEDAAEEARWVAPFALSPQGADVWRRHVALHSHDPNGRIALEVAGAWASAIERRLDGKMQFTDVAESAMDDVLREPRWRGLTAPQYAMVVGVLAQAWVYGETLRLWSNRRGGL